MFDHNGDGYISKLELHRTMNELGIELTREDLDATMMMMMERLYIELTREDLDAMMTEADVNRDGRIDYAGQSL